MTPELQAQLDAFLVQYFSAVGDVGALESLLLRESRLQVNAAITLPELERTLLSLADRNFISSYFPSIGLRRWAMSEVGRRKAREMGLA